MKISLLNELFIFTGTLEKFNLNGSRIDDLHASFLPSTWSKARSLRSQPVARYLLNHNTASRVKKKKKKTKQAIKGQRRLRAIPFNESTPCSREGRHSSSLASLNADNGREIGEITPENHPRFHAHGPTAHLYSLSFRSVRCVALFPPHDRSVKHKWSRRTKNGCWRLRENGTHLFDECVSHRLLLQRRYWMLVLNPCMECFSFSLYTSWLLQLDLEILIKEYLLDTWNCDYIPFLWNFMVSARKNSSSFI